MDSDSAAEVTALAINVTIPEPLRWTDTRRGETFTPMTLKVRMLADGHLAARAYGAGRRAVVAAPMSRSLSRTILRWRRWCPMRPAGPAHFGRPTAACADYHPGAESA